MAYYKNPDYERFWLRKLKKVIAANPGDLWLFVNGSGIHVMRKKDGQRVMTVNGGVDPAYVVTTITGIETDGGDW